MTLLLLAACGPEVFSTGGYTIEVDEKTATLQITHDTRGDGLRDLKLFAGTGESDIEFNVGSYRFTELSEDLRRGASVDHLSSLGQGLVLVSLEDADGNDLGDLTFGPGGDDTLNIDFLPRAGSNRVALEADCDVDDHFLGLGAHAFDVDHVGEAFALWVSEPGIGKSDQEAYPDDWFLTGTRHSSSYPVPLLVRPQQAHALAAYTPARVEVDLCHSDPDRFRITTWDDRSVRFALVSGDGPLDVVEHVNRDLFGLPQLPPPWALAPWNDAIKGEDRVREVAATIREADAPSSVIWTEDWKGGEENAVGYHLTGEWFVDETLYPDATGLAQELEDLGFKWFAYFAPFLEEDTITWDEAIAADVVIQTQDGEPYTFSGPTFQQFSMVDLTLADGRDFAIERMVAALDVGFDGWMADYAEWLPTDAVLGSGEDAMRVHNDVPRLWQATNLEAQSGYDATFFARSGWVGTQSLAPIVWAGDQRTSFDADDGLPTILPLGLGLSASGVTVYTHDIAGYQSIGNDPSDRELWYRWASLGAFSPVMRTHHGAFADDNHQFDTDFETLEFWGQVTREHTRLWPYRYGLAALAADQGTPMLLPVGWIYDDAWDRIDAWLLGAGMLVAPVLKQGVTGREVSLPDQVTWYDWWTHEPVQSGWFDADIDEIPVFIAAGTTVPTFETIPDTLTTGASGDVLDLDDVDAERVVTLFGGGGPFSEADGTTYTPTGTPTGAGEDTVTVDSGNVTVAGVTLAISGTVTRTYRVVVVP